MSTLWEFKEHICAIKMCWQMYGWDHVTYRYTLRHLDYFWFENWPVLVGAFLVYFVLCFFLVKKVLRA